ncbi:MAG: glycosyltransferase [Microcoleaceae cyanobacterium]
MNHPKRITFLLSDLRFGGIPNVTLNLINSIIKQNFLIDLVVLTLEASPYLSKLPPEVRVIDLKKPIPDARLKNALRIISPISDYLRTEKPDFLVSNLWMYNVFAILAKAIANVPTKLTVVEHDHLLIELKNYEQSTNNFVSGFQTRLLPLLVGLFYPWTDNIIAVSHGLARDLETEFKLKPNLIKTIYNPIINVNLWDKAQEFLNHSWFKDEQPPVILGVGRLCQEKDFPTLIRSFALVRKQRNTRLMILGEGEERSNLEKLIQELGLDKDVLMPGFVTNPYAYIAKASVFVLSSIREGLPTVLVEAMALNTPVVSTKAKGGVLEILADGTFGDVVPVGDFNTMAEAIVKVLDGNQKTIDSDWLQQFTQENAAKKYLEVISVSNHKSSTQI